MKLSLTASAMFFAIGVGAVSSAAALTLKEESDKGKIVSRGTSTVIDVGGKRFALVEFNAYASEFKFYDKPSPEFPQMRSFYVSGPEPTKEEIVAVLDVDYEDKAFDAASIEVRNLKIVKRGYISWCSLPAIFACRNYVSAAGTWIEFEDNGKNREGGMTGWHRRTVLMGRLPDAVTPADPPASAAASQ